MPRPNRRPASSTGLSGAAAHAPAPVPPSWQRTAIGIESFDDEGPEHDLRYAALRAKVNTLLDVILKIFEASRPFDLLQRNRTDIGEDVLMDILSDLDVRRAVK